MSFKVEEMSWDNLSVSIFMSELSAFDRDESNDRREERTLSRLLFIGCQLKYQKKIQKRTLRLILSLSRRQCETRPDAVPTIDIFFQISFLCQSSGVATRIIQKLDDAGDILLGSEIEAVTHVGLEFFVVINVCCLGRIIIFDLKWNRILPWSDRLLFLQAWVLLVISFSISYQGYHLIGGSEKLIWASD